MDEDQPTFVDFYFILIAEFCGIDVFANSTNSTIRILSLNINILGQQTEKFRNNNKFIIQHCVDELCAVVK